MFLLVFLCFIFSFQQFYQQDLEVPFTEDQRSSSLRSILESLQDYVEEINDREIIGSFIHINFLYLRSLAITRVNIVSIQNMVKLQAPNLQSLQFTSCQIYNFKSLRKMYVPKLKKLTIYQNQIADLDFLWECNFAPEMQELGVFNASQSQAKRLLPASYNFIFKLNSRSLKIFQYYNTQIIRNKVKRDMIDQKFLGATQIKLRYDALE